MLAEFAWQNAEISPAASSSAGRTLKQISALAGRSFAIARLAARLATRGSLDAEQAYLLGLLHAAPQWLARGEKPGSDDSLPSDLLPSWFGEALRTLTTSKEHSPTSPADCVAASLRMAGSRRVATHRVLGIAFRRQAFADDVADVAADWLSDSPVAAALPALAAKLQRLNTLERDFERRLEHEKLESLKELAYGAGHEINNPLANISARADPVAVGE